VTRPAKSIYRIATLELFLISEYHKELKSDIYSRMDGFILPVVIPTWLPLLKETSKSKNKNENKNKNKADNKNKNPLRSQALTRPSKSRINAIPQRSS